MAAGNPRAMAGTASDAFGAFGRLTTDHRRAEALLARLAGADGLDRQATLDELEDLLDRHMEVEETALYPALRRLGPDADAAREPQVEHGLVRDGLDDVRQLLALPGFGAAVDMLGGALAHHLEREERDLFPRLQREMTADELARLAEASPSPSTSPLPSPAAAPAAANVERNG
jgi:hypothetical protein